jgi:hypothetical protein
MHPGIAQVALAAAVLLAPAFAAHANGECRYDVDVSPDLALDVAVRCGPGVSGLKAVDESARAAAQSVRAQTLPGGYAAHYRVELAAMAAQRDSIDSALRVGDSIVTVGAAWLLRPVREGGAPGTLSVRVNVPEPIGFATAQPMVGGAFRVPEAELAHAGFSAFGRFAREAMTAPGDDSSVARFEVIVLDGPLDIERATLLGWIRDMAHASATFWRGFPGDGMRIFVVPRAGRADVPFGRDMAGGGVSMVLYVGEHATRAALYDDWVLIHELVHVGSPFVQHAPWFTEGLATYLEPLIRARQGLQTPEAMWIEFMTHMPRGAAVMAGSGLVRGGFRGFYWGGALLMLLADMELRQASGGVRGLEDCLVTIRRTVGNYTRILSVDAMVAACDAVSGSDVLARVVARYARAANAVDLDALWASLGLKLTEGRLTVDDAAPLAHVRRAIVSAKPG